MAECNVDDILCQLKMLESLRSLKANMGNESFRERFPELVGIDEKLTSEIESQEFKLKGKINECGKMNADEIPEEIIDFSPDDE